MKRVDALRGLVSGNIEDVKIRLNGSGFAYNANEIIQLYEYLDEDLPDAKSKKVKTAKPVSEYKADQPRRGKVIDAGKLLALHKAGWKAPQIAEELKCSEATVYNYLKKCKEEAKA